MIVRNGTLVTIDGPIHADMRIRKRSIVQIGNALPARRHEPVVEAEGRYVFPGLINGHDHLEFNLYARLGTPPYRNAYDWGPDLHSKFGDEIRAIESIPRRLRFWWGAWKNLFSGVTTVVHHGAISVLHSWTLPVRIPRRLDMAHSLQFDEDLDRSLRKRKEHRPFMIHLAEGVDGIASREIQALQEAGGLDSHTVAIHAIALRNGGLDLLKKSGASVVWCPSSNLFLYGSTTPVKSLLPSVRVVLGTDSTLTGLPTLFDEMRAARKCSGLTAKQLFRMVTTAARDVFGLPHGAGRLTEGGPADFFLVQQTKKDPMDALLSLKPADIELLVQDGRVLFRDEQFHQRLLPAGSSVRFRVRTKIVAERGFRSRFEAIRPTLTHYDYLAPENAV